MPIEIRELVIKTNVSPQRATTIQIQINNTRAPAGAGSGAIAVRSSGELVMLLRRWGVGGGFSGTFLIESEMIDDPYAARIVWDLKQSGFRNARFEVGGRARVCQAGRDFSNARTVELRL